MINKTTVREKATTEQFYEMRQKSEIWKVYQILAINYIVSNDIESVGLKHWHRYTAKRKLEAIITERNPHTTISSGVAHECARTELFT